MLVTLLLQALHAAHLQWRKELRGKLDTPHTHFPLHNSTCAAADGPPHCPAMSSADAQGSGLRAAVALRTVAKFTFRTTNAQLHSERAVTADMRSFARPTLVHARTGRFTQSFRAHTFEDSGLASLDRKRLAKAVADQRAAEKREHLRARRQEYLAAQEALRRAKQERQRILQAEKRRKREAAVVMQAVARGWLAKRRTQLLRHALHSAMALRIQRWFRSTVIRLLRVRREMKVRALRRRAEAATIISRFVRHRMLRQQAIQLAGQLREARRVRRAQLMFRTRHHAATMLQAAFRGFRVRVLRLRKAKKWRKARGSAPIK